VEQGGYTYRLHDAVCHTRKRIRVLASESSPDVEMSLSLLATSSDLTRGPFGRNFYFSTMDSFAISKISLLQPSLTSGYILRGRLSFWLVATIVANDFDVLHSIAAELTVKKLSSTM